MAISFDCIDMEIWHCHNTNLIRPDVLVIKGGNKYKERWTTKWSYRGLVFSFWGMEPFKLTYRCDAAKQFRCVHVYMLCNDQIRFSATMNPWTSKRILSYLLVFSRKTCNEKSKATLSGDYFDSIVMKYYNMLFRAHFFASFVRKDSIHASYPAEDAKGDLL